MKHSINFIVLRLQIFEATNAEPCYGLVIKNNQIKGELTWDTI